MWQKISLSHYSIAECVHLVIKKAFIQKKIQKKSVDEKAFDRMIFDTIFSYPEAPILNAFVHFCISKLISFS